MQRPEWIKAKAPAGANYEEVKSLVESARLHTVCQSANCPNIGECWHERTATFMILGNTCTRNCRFCAVGWSGISYPGPSDGRSLGPVDTDEPRRVAHAAAYLKLRHAVITSVTRDDLPDGGASIFADTIRLIREAVPGCSIEVLIPDFQGSEDALSKVVDAQPQILNHNVETAERCYLDVRPQADYNRSLALLRRAKQMAESRELRADSFSTKSGLMVGVGETWDEIVRTMADLRAAQCDILTIGQYLAPSEKHHPISRYYTPEEFAELERIGGEIGFAHVESGPLVRSSYHAAQHVQ